MRDTCVLYYVLTRRILLVRWDAELGRWQQRCFFFSPNHTSHEIRDWFSDKCNSIYNYLAVAVLLVLQQLCYTIFLWPSSSRSACCHHILTFYSHIWSLRPRPEKGQSKETGQLTFSKADHSFWETESEMRGLQQGNLNLSSICSPLGRKRSGLEFLSYKGSILLHHPVLLKYLKS